MADTDEQLAELKREAQRLENEKARTALAVATLELASKQIEAQRASVSALVPDLSKAVAYETQVSGSTHVLGPTLGLQAAEAAATRLVNEVMRRAGERPTSVLIVAGLDAHRRMIEHLNSVRASVERLEGRAAAVLDATGAAAGPSTDGATRALFPPAAGGAALAAMRVIGSAIPVALSLLNVKHAVSSAKGDLTASAAVPAVAGAFLQHGVKVMVHGSASAADADPPPDGSIAFRLEALEGECRTTLLTRARALADLKSAHLGARLAAELSRAALLAATPPGDTQSLDDAIGAAAAGAEAAGFAHKLVIDVVAEIDALSAAVRQASAEGTIADGVCRAQRELGAGHVLVIDAAVGSSDQFVSDRPLWSVDKMCVLAHAVISYVLLRQDGTTAAAGCVPGAMSASVRLGSGDPTIRISAETPGDV